ncbi:MAG TPA: TolC family protein [Phycisphaerae bacterium]|nr:TolC family protein [Phycisphaerae bacterium]
MIERCRLIRLVPPLLAALGGCVLPGEMDETIVTRYQRAMASRAAQPRMAREGLGSLRPVPGETGPKLPVEDIVNTKTVEFIETYKVLGTEQGRKRVEVRRTNKVTTYGEDPKTGTLTPQVKVDEWKPVIVVVDEVPKDIHEVQIFRVGRQSRAPSIIKDSRNLIRLSLDEAILRALANNLDIRVVSYNPAISREEMIKAAAVFDFVVYGGTTYAKDEKARATQFVADITRDRQWRVGIGQIRSARGQEEHKTLTGATWSLEWSMSRTWDNSTYSTLLRTRYEPTVTLQITQPLLRYAWPEFNLAQLRIARLNSKITDADFRLKVEEVVTQVIATYWALAQARRELEIQEKLLAQTRKTHKRTVGRRDLDASSATIKQAEASVRIRQAVLIRARKSILDVQEALARLLADAQIHVHSRNEVVPTTPMIVEKVHVSAAEQLLTALRCNPLLEQARLAIAAAEISVSVAKNHTLPTLDLTASTELQGLGGTVPKANDKLLRGDYASYSIGLMFDYPIGNRHQMANLKQRKLERTQAIVSMQNTADQLAVAVSERVRQIGTAYEEMAAQRAAVEAAAVQLQALEDTERIRAQLTPEFLRVKLQAQETLANSERAELQALVDYNNAMADLARATGTVLELRRIEIALPAVVDKTWPGAGGPATAPVPPKKP